MVYAVATERGIKLPGCFGYAPLASVVLVALFLPLTWLPIVPNWRLH